MKTLFKSNQVAISVIIASLAVAYYGKAVDTLPQIEHPQTAEYPERILPPYNQSQWIFKSIRLSQVNDYSTLSISQSGDILLRFSGSGLSPRSSLLISKSGTEAVKNGFPTLSLNDELLPESDEITPESGIAPIPQIGRLKYEMDLDQNAIRVSDPKAKNDPVIAGVLDRQNQSFGSLKGFFLSPYDELTFVKQKNSEFQIFRTEGMTSPQVILSGSSDEKVSVFDVLPSKLKTGNHLIVSIDKSVKVLSNGMEWKLSTLPGYKPVPQVFASPDIVVGRMMKYSKEGLLMSATIAFWNRDGKFCILDDALPANRDLFQTLLSPFGGLNRKTQMHTNYIDTVTLSLCNFDYSRSVDDGPHYMKTIILRFDKDWAPQE